MHTWGCLQGAKAASGAREAGRALGRRWRGVTWGSGTGLGASGPGGGGAGRQPRWGRWPPRPSSCSSSPASPAQPGLSPALKHISYSWSPSPGQTPWGALCSHPTGREGGGRAVRRWPTFVPSTELRRSPMLASPPRPPRARPQMRLTCPDFCRPVSVPHSWGRRGHQGNPLPSPDLLPAAPMPLPTWAPSTSPGARLPSRADANKLQKFMVDGKVSTDL